ncbi:hypothetical protein [Flavihumibacter petaseus]|uniref:Uncharacterized protein n=1 Tax=Flavihumibacter petaseus NBRC 106054 TaxID=1220578 RepID=A0A0E9N3B0_9BACT|nr:hypothetical protein [Flavihumibacter petaseus]GAO44156.1 hypothetical protein FPE01S_03_01940 [Flavihumibacter petaseus NBRC 106054]
MKKLVLPAVALFLSLAFLQTAAAQTAPGDSSRPAATGKGYYSIGDNASRKYSAGLKLAADGPAPEVKKGYYAIGDNNKKLPRQTVLYVQPQPRKADKGYYSIPQ